MLVYYKCFIILLTLMLMAHNMFAENISPDKTILMPKEQVAAFANIPSYIWVRLSDKPSDKIEQLVIERNIFSDYLFDASYLSEHKRLQMLPYDYYAVNADKSIQIDLEHFNSHLKAKFTDRFTKSMHFKRPLSLSDLEVDSVDELISRFFYIDENTHSGRVKPDVLQQSGYHFGSAEFIALLILHGYHAYRGDFVPILVISKREQN